MNQLISELKAKPKVFYILRRTDIDEIFYVGCTSQSLKTRLRGHRNGKQKTADIIKKYPVVIERIYNERPGDDWQKLEREFIAEYRADGHPLINECDGGIGGKGAKRTKEAMDKTILSTQVEVYLMHVYSGNIHNYKSIAAAARAIMCKQPAVSRALKSGGVVNGYLCSYTNEFKQSENSKNYNKNKFQRHPLHG